MTGARGTLNDISVAIGELKADVRNLGKKVDVEAETAAKHRDSLRQVIAAQTEATRVLAQWKEEWQPILETYKQQEAERTGRIKLGKGLVAVWIAIAGFFGAIVAKLIELWPWGHH